ncbi:MAG TPA: hypothetical protein VFM15_04320 [Gammaproteobacteria bacterium]|nr:hypothetical protein [Gammaproteobacteria bacterium]
MLLIIAAILFALGALGGLVMAIRVFRQQPIPVALAAGHGILAASGLVLLIVAALLGAAGSTALIALVILVIAALGGFYLLSFHVRRQSHPKAVIVIHALVAVIGFLTLLTAIYQQASA